MNFSPFFVYLRITKAWERNPLSQPGCIYTFFFNFFFHIYIQRHFNGKDVRYKRFEEKRSKPSSKFLRAIPGVWTRTFCLWGRSELIAMSYQDIKPIGKEEEDLLSTPSPLQTVPGYFVCLPCILNKSWRSKRYQSVLTSQRQYSPSLPFFITAKAWSHLQQGPLGSKFKGTVLLIEMEMTYLKTEEKNW